MNQRQQNNTFSGAALRYDDREEEMAVFELLPKSICDVLNYCNVKLSAISCAEYGMRLQREGVPNSEIVKRIVVKIREIEANEISVFSGRHKAQYGYELPHVAARATLQVYAA